MSLALIVKYTDENISIHSVNELICKFITENLEFFPIDKRLTDNYSAIGILIFSHADKQNIFKFSKSTRN